MPNPDKLRHRPSVPEIRPLVQELYKEHCAGGCLHIVLDDGNLSDDCVQHCVEYAEEQGEMHQAQLARLLLMMSMTQRKKLQRLPHFDFERGYMVMPPEFQPRTYLGQLCEKYLGEGLQNQVQSTDSRDVSTTLP